MSYGYEDVNVETLDATFLHVYNLWHIRATLSPKGTRCAFALGVRLRLRYHQEYLTEPY